MNINLRTREGWDDLKRELDRRLPDVLAMCGITLPDRTSKSGTIVIDDPRGSGKENFAIWLKADGLSWKCFTNGACGRSLELIAHCQGWYHLDRRGADQAANFAIDRLGLGRISKEELERDRANAAAQTEKHREEAKAESDSKANRAFAIFVNAKSVLGTAADRYLCDARGINLAGPPFVGPRGGKRAPSALRFIASHKYVIRNRNGDKCGESFHPCMVACCVDQAGRVRAVHQTWLAADGSDKAYLRLGDDGTRQKQRKVFGDSLGCVIPLWRGDGHLTVAEANAAGMLQTLVLCEGVEDGLSAVLAAPQHRVWAAISLSNIAHVAQRLPDCCDTVIVHQQNDWAKPGAVAQFEDAIAALRRTGRIVSIVKAAIGKDLNDTLRGAA